MHRCVFLGRVFIALLGFSEGLTAAHRLRIPSDKRVLLRWGDSGQIWWEWKREEGRWGRGIQVRLHKEAGFWDWGLGELTFLVLLLCARHCSRLKFTRISSFL